MQCEKDDKVIFTSDFANNAKFVGIKFPTILNSFKSCIRQTLKEGGSWGPG